MIKFLIDNALSPFVSEYLKSHGFDSVHVKDYGMQASSDEDIFVRAKNEDRVIISADTDFSYILADLSVNSPSVILFRKGIERKPKEQAKLLVSNLNKELITALENGCIVIFEPERIRIRKLPIK